MARSKTLYICTNCDAQFPKWSGQCFECGKWGTVEQAAGGKKKPSVSPDAPSVKTTKLTDIKQGSVKRTSTNISELDRVLGGGFVPGGYTLLGGEPGIGKSTLSIQLANIIPDTIYFSGEESIGQIKLRAERLGLTSKTLELANETHVESICATITKQQPALAIVDSIQTIYSSDVDSETGNVNQVRACATKLLETAKKSNTCVILIGHVTKEGRVAGPKTLEHLVDTVLYLEGDKHQHFRVLRSIKNRFGSTDEIGIFDMTEKGLQEVTNASGALLEERAKGLPGSVVTCLLEGTRPLLVEVQALVNKTSFGYPVRKANGFDANRLHMLIAVLERRAGLNLSQYDVYINVVGGIKANEPAADLAIALAIASAYKDKELAETLVAFGEVGLGGEIRSVSQAEKRIKEAKALGMKTVITKSHQKTSDDLKIIAVSNIDELVKKT